MDSFVREKLTEWQLDSLADTFEDQEVDKESFLLLDDCAIACLISKVGLRVKFQKHHKELVAVHSNLQSSKDSHGSRETVETGMEVQTQPNPITLTLQLSPVFEIRKVLEGSMDGRSMLKSLDELQSITSKERKLLVRLLVSHLLETNGETPSSDIKRALAMSLVNEFPCLKDDTGSGYGAWFTPGRKHRPATGFLEERLRNIRKPLRNLRRPHHQESEEEHTVSAQESCLAPEKLQEMVDWLKVNKYPVSEVEAYMKETVIYRGKWIRSNGSKSIPEILKEFPRLVDNPGMTWRNSMQFLPTNKCTNISQDFQQLHPDGILAYIQREGKLNVALDDMTPAAAGAAPGDERGGPDQTQQRQPVVILSVADDERVEADMRGFVDFYVVSADNVVGWSGCTAASIHRRDPTTERHGGFDLLRLRPGPVDPSLDDLVVPGSPRSTISIRNLVRTPDQHSPLQLRAPELKRSSSLSLPS
ncbi:uncharacterized protein LOC126408083 [Epinephelus moara]|uniref:uncharacterized protein LOC126408083 n=1 Tax=Epinephelus moara TaxID=300413 RepID=UPI00214EC924|nr:uncharacterized protein LOC126408083 [Epinephelus moara]